MNIIKVMQRKIWRIIF